MTDYCTHHPERVVIELSGTDKAIFLQGLITQDIELLKTQEIIYGLLLSPQGRFQFELFVIKVSDELWLLDVEAEHAATLFKKLQMYKLRSAVEIKVSNDWNAGISSQPIMDGDPVETNNSVCIIDPRNAKIGYRLYQKTALNYHPQDFEHYQNLRLMLAIPEGSKDMIIDKSIPLEWNMEQLNAISFTKGCYMGQELTARTKHVGMVRKRVMPVKFEKLGSYPKGCSLIQNGKTIGSLGSSNDIRGLALIYSDFDKTQKILLDNIDCYIATDIAGI